PGLPPNSSQGPLPSPRFRHRPLHFDTSSAVRWCSSLQISPDGVYPAFSCDAHHQRSERQQLAVVWILRLIAGSEGPTLISLAAPHLLCSWCARGTRSASIYLDYLSVRRHAWDGSGGPMVSGGSYRPVFPLPAGVFALSPAQRSAGYVPDRA